MKKNEIIKLGIRLGLSYNEKINFPDLLSKDFVVFDGCNGQRFSVDGKNLTDDEIYADMGKFLKLIGRREKCLEISRVLSINSD